MADRLVSIILLGPSLLLAPAAGQDAPEIAAPSFFAVSVADLDAAQEWYRRTLGVEPARSVTSRDGRSRAVVMRRDELVIELVAYRDSRAPERLMPGIDHSFAIQGLVKAGIWVNDATAWHTYLVGLGVGLDGAVLTDDVIDARTFVFRDPGGNRIQVFERCDGPCSNIQASGSGSSRPSRSSRSVPAASSLPRPRR